MGDNTGHWLKAYVDHEDRRLHKKIDEGFSSEKAAREAADAELQDGIDAEKSAREAADAELQDRIDAEKTAREAADTNLQAALDAEVESRTSEAESLQSAVDTHTADKSNPHDVTKAQIGLGDVDNTSDLDKPISTAAQSALGAEQTARETADETLQAAIDDEKSARENAEAQLQAAIDELPEQYAKKEDMAGKKVQPGQSFATENSSTIEEAGIGAEIFNDYRERVFDDSGIYVEIGNVATGQYSHAEGMGTTAMGDFAHAEGELTLAKGQSSHAEGIYTFAKGIYSHTEGEGTEANGNSAHAEGYSSAASGASAHAEGRSTEASGSNAHAEGFTTTASAQSAHAEGYDTNATGQYSHAEGYSSATSGESAHAEGRSTEASGSNAHAEGFSTTASAQSAHAEGRDTKASGSNAHAEGRSTEASGSNSHAEGYYTIAKGYQHVCGKYNVEIDGPQTGTSSDGALFIVGNGTSNSNRSNAFRVDTNGEIYSAGQYNTTGADYAERFEWKDKNTDGEDRRGLFVTLDGEKIRLANSDDKYILGAISATPSVVGDAQEDYWRGKYLRDVFGELLTETVTVDEYTDEDTGELVPQHDEKRYILSPDYNPDAEYVSRDKRAEWAKVGMMGKLVVVDDGTCEVNGYCKPTDGGIATKAENGYRVMSRIDETHIKILFR